MRYVILRDDDTNALTPIDCLERLYRPFLGRGLPVNLAVIPDVATNATTPEGNPEGFLTTSWNDEHRTVAEAAITSPSPPRRGEEYPSPAGGGEGGRRPDEGCGEENKLCGRGEVVLRAQGEYKDTGASILTASHSTSAPASRTTIPIGSNPELVHYLRDNSGYHIVQHGCHHDYFEFDRSSPAEITARLDRGAKLLAEAGFPKPDTFVAPHDKFSRPAYCEIQKHFPVISCGWFERRRLPMTWWPNYLARKIRRTPHWRVGDTTLLSHPGCLLSWRRAYASMLDEVSREIQCRRLTVLVTHWWEYFRDGQPDEEFIAQLHKVAEYLVTQPDVRVISFSDVAENRIPLN